MTHTSRRITYAAFALGAGLLSLTAGCSAGQSEAAATAPPKPSASASSVSASPKPPATPEDQAVVAARKAVSRYYQVTNNFGMKPQTNLAALKIVSISTGFYDAANEVAFYRRRGLRQIGATRIVYQHLVDVTLDYQPKSTPPRIPTVRLMVCFDVHNVNVVDAKNRSVVTATRPATGVMLFGVSNYSWPRANGWKVSFTQEKSSKCRS